jgi:hypothetical protein
VFRGGLGKYERQERKAKVGPRRCIGGDKGGPGGREFVVELAAPSSPSRGQK